MNVDGNYVLDALGEPVQEHDLLTWARWRETHRAECLVQQTRVGPVMVSTLFLAVDYAHFGGRPILFETMVFGGALDYQITRYHTRAEAERGHDLVVLVVERYGRVPRRLKKALRKKADWQPPDKVRAQLRAAAREVRRTGGLYLARFVRYSPGLTVGERRRLTRFHTRVETYRARLEATMP